MLTTSHLTPTIATIYQRALYKDTRSR